jgi:methionine biosynthesis protein MetW
MTVGYDLVLDEIPEQAKVLDLGCGDGSLLVMLQDKKKVKGFGVEISEEGVSLCVEKGLYCYQADIDDGLSDYKDDSFDYVILNQTIQNTKRPDYVIKEVLRIGKKAIISFPNFAYISTRSYLMFKGTMPVNELLPYEWYESPNIHLLTISDMKRMAGAFGFNILEEKNFSYTKKGRSRLVKCFPNLLAQYGFFVIEKRVQQKN